MKLLNLLPGDVPKTAWAAVIAFAVAVGQIAAEASYQSLFSMRFGIEYLPLMYLIEVGIIPLEIWFFVKLTEWHGKAAFLKLVYGGLTAVVLCNSMILLCLQFFGIQAVWFYPLLFLTSNIADRGFVTVMWVLAEDMCTTRQAKRIFPVLIGCYTLGSIITGFFINHTNSGSGGISPEMIYLIWPCMMMIGGIAWRQVVVRYIQPMSALAEDEQPSDMLSSIRIIGKSAFLRVAILVMVLLYGVAFLMEYELTAVSKAACADEEELTAFWGLFLAVYYTSGLLVGGLILGPLLERFGIGNVVVMTTGLATAAFFQMTLFAAGPWTLTAVFIGGVMMYVVMYTIADPTYQLFFKTIPARQRTGVRLVFGGALFAGGKLLCSGLAALHSLGIVNLTYLSLLGLLLSLCMLVLAIRQKRLYFIQLINHVRDRVLPLQEMPFGLIGRKLSAAEVAPVKALLDGDKRKVKLGLEIYGSLHVLHATEAALQLTSFLTDDDAEIRLLALRALASEGGMVDLSPFRQALQDEDIRVVAEALRVLGKAGDDATRESRMQLLRKLLADGGETAVHACEVIGAIGAAEYGADIHEVLKSSRQPALGLAAVQCLGRLGWVAAVPDMMSGMEQRDSAYAKAVAQSLGAIGLSAEPLIRQGLQQEESKIWRTSVTALAEMHSVKTADFLVDSCEKQLEGLQKSQEIVWALHETGQPKLAVLAEKRFYELWLDCCEGAWAVLSIFADRDHVRSVKDSVYSRDCNKREAGLDILAEGLGCRRLSQAMLRAIEKMDGHEPEQGADPIEILHSAVWADAWIKKILDAGKAERERGGGMGMEEQGGEIEKLILLGQAAPFKNLALEEISRIAQIAGLERHDDQTFIIRAGQAVPCMYVIAEGYVEISGMISGGRSATIRVLKENEFFGEESIMSDTPSVITAQVIMGDATLLAIDGEALKRLVHSYPDIALGMLAEASVRLNRLQWQLVAQS